MSSSSTPVILTKSADWDLWISFVKTRSIKIWPNINPDLAEKPASLPEPIAPLFLIPDNGVIDPNALALHKAKSSNYKTLLAAYEKQQRVFDEIIQFIQSTISTTNAIHIERVEPHPYNILKALKQKLAPSDQARSLDIEQNYHRIIKGPRDQDLEKWLDEWTKIYTLAKEYNIGEVTNTDRPIRDFLLAVQSIDASFTTTYMIKLTEAPNTLDLFTIIENFRHIARLKKKEHETTYNSSNSAFSADNRPTFRGTPARSTSNNSPIEPSRCPCGTIHWWADCEYLNPSMQKPGWKPDPHIQKKIDSLDEGFKDKIEKSINKRAEIEGKKKPGDARPTTLAVSTRPPTPQPNLGTFPVSTMPSASASYSLNSSWILDHGSNAHICNSTMRHRFTKERDGNGAKIATGNQFLEIEAYGTIQISFKGKNDDEISITLTNVIYIPNFMTNVVSGSRLASKGLHFDTYQAKFHMNGNIIGYAPLYEGHYVMERNPIVKNNPTTMPLSTDPITSDFSPATKPIIPDFSPANKPNPSDIPSSANRPTSSDSPSANGPITSNCSPTSPISSTSPTPPILSTNSASPTSIPPISIDPPTTYFSSMSSHFDLSAFTPSPKKAPPVPLCAFSFTDAPSKIPLYFSSYSASNLDFFIDPINICTKNPSIYCS